MLSGAPDGFLVLASSSVQLEQAKVMIQESILNSRNLEFKELVVVDVSDRGRVIGKGGCNMKKIQSDCEGVVISTQDQGFLVMASTDEIVQRAKIMILGLLRKHKS